jgi:hypothetical protein
MSSIFKIGIIILIITIIVCSIYIEIKNSSTISVVKDCKVIQLQQQQIIRGSDGNMSTDIRYLVITDKETFICESSFINGKYNNSDIFWRLKKDSTYTFKVAGIGKSFLFDYRNILQYY